MNTPLIKPSLIYLINLADEMKNSIDCNYCNSCRCCYCDVCIYIDRLLLQGTPKTNRKKVVENFGYIRNMLYACVYSDTEQRNLLRNACRCTTDTTEHPKRR